MKTTIQMDVPYSYLSQQFQGQKRSGILRDIEQVVDAGDFTLGKKVQEFEEAFADVCGVKHAIGVNSGTDALFLIMKALGIGAGDSVVTVPNTFMATVGAILATGAKPVFSDIDDNYCMGEDALKETCLNHHVAHRRPPIATLPVFWGGHIQPGSFLAQFAISDACQSIGGTYYGDQAGAIGNAAAFSLHPLKNVNIWGDGGVVATNDYGLADEIRLLRNHGLQGRDTWVKPGYNSRLHTIQAVVGLHVLKDLEWVTERRIANAKRYDEGLSNMGFIKVPPRDPNVRHVFHLYQVEIAHGFIGDNIKNRTGLVGHLNERGIEAKVHYPTPLHLQPALEHLGYKRGDFPRAEQFANTHITLPIHQYLSEEQIDYTIDTIRNYF